MAKTEKLLCSPLACHMKLPSPEHQTIGSLWSSQMSSGPPGPGSHMQLALEMTTELELGTQQVVHCS